MYYNIKTIENIIENITQERTPIIKTYEDISIVTMRITEVKRGLIKKIEVLSYTISIQDNKQELLNLLSPEHKELFIKYDPKMWEILHEIGHTKTVKGLSNLKFQCEKGSFHNLMESRKIPIDEQQKKYRQLISERRADKWAYNWALKHPKEMEFASHNLRVTMW